MTSYKEMFRVFGRIGVLSFGGPAGQIALMHKELVEERPWLEEDEYLRALSFCMMLPGPEAMQLATYCGWKMRGIPGGLLAGLLFVLPGALVILALGLFYAVFGTVPLAQAVFIGVKAAVLAIVLQALLRLSGKALAGPAERAIALLAFLAIFALGLPFPLIVLGAAVAGALFLRREAEEVSSKATRRTPLSVLAGFAALWLAPLAIFAALDHSFLFDLAAFFAKLAVVTFGGAYAVLAYMTQAVVSDHGWLTTGQMIDALGLAETTPGPLILVTEFVGVLAGYHIGGLGLALLAGVVTLWMTFVPCFLWIFAGAPYIARLSAWPKLRAALAGITASVVGVIANLSLWFALHVWFDSVVKRSVGPLELSLPQLASANAVAIALSCIALILFFAFRLSMLRALALMAVLGLATSLL